MACKRSGVRLSYAPPKSTARKRMTGTSPHSIQKVAVPLWLWPRILSLDAPAIAIIWQLCIAKLTAYPISPAACTVLFLSVWLTYAADRLFDVRKQSIDCLQSYRHQWSKRYTAKIWRIWYLVLIVDILCAFCFLESWQLQQGVCLLSFCLSYTLLNQWLSRYWFPKEAFVGIIFSAGVLVFFPLEGSLSYCILLSSLFFLNCLIVGIKERSIDEALGDHSLSSAGKLYRVLMLAACLAVNWRLLPMCQELIPLVCFSWLCLGSLYLQRKKITVETYGVAADGCLLPAPVFVLLFN